MTKYCACHEKWHCNSSCGHKRPKLAVTSDQNLRSQATPRPELTRRERMTHSQSSQHKAKDTMMMKKKKKMMMIMIMMIIIMMMIMMMVLITIVIMMTMELYKGYMLTNVVRCNKKHSVTQCSFKYSTLEVIRNSSSTGCQLKHPWLRQSMVIIMSNFWLLLDEYQDSSGRTLLSIRIFRWGINLRVRMYSIHLHIHKFPFFISMDMQPAPTSKLFLSLQFSTDIHILYYSYKIFWICLERLSQPSAIDNDKQSLLLTFYKQVPNALGEVDDCHFWVPKTVLNTNTACSQSQTIVEKEWKRDEMK